MSHAKFFISRQVFSLSGLKSSRSQVPNYSLALFRLRWPNLWHMVGFAIFRVPVPIARNIASDPGDDAVWPAMLFLYRAITTARSSLSLGIGLLMAVTFLVLGSIE